MSRRCSVVCFGLWLCVGCGSLTAPDTELKRADASAGRAAAMQPPIASGDASSRNDAPARCEDGNKNDHDGCSADARVEIPCWLRLYEHGPLDEVYGVFVYETHARRFHLAFGDSDPTANWAYELPRGWVIMRQPAPAELHGAGRSMRGAYDTAHQRTLTLADPAADGGNELVPVSWVFDATLDWRSLASGREIAPSAYYGIAYDEARDRTIVVGGIRNAPALNGLDRALSADLIGDVWELADDAWTRRLDREQPEVTERAGFAFAYHAADRRAYLFGGMVSSALGASADLWAYDSNGWTRVDTPGARPRARVRATMTYDPRRGSLLMYGGELNTGELSNETWELRGGEWHELRSPNGQSPPNVHSASFAYDVHRGYSLLFGGARASKERTDVPSPDPELWLLQWLEPEACVRSEAPGWPAPLP